MVFKRSFLRFIIIKLSIPRRHFVRGILTVAMIQSKTTRMGIHLTHLEMPGCQALGVILVPRNLAMICQKMGPDSRSLRTLPMSAQKLSIIQPWR
jgi:hypothetical protein